MRSKLDSLGNSLSALIENTNISAGSNNDRVEKYLDWLIKKTDYINIERQPVRIPDKAIPKTINGIRYSKLPIKEQQYLERFYVRSGNDYILNCPLFSIDETSRERIARDLLLAKGRVCWVEFGFNIGSEYGGRHPAVVIRNYRNTLLVIPLTSQEPEKERDYLLEVPFVHDLQKKRRWAVISSLTTISTHRVDFNGHFGRVTGEIINAIRERLVKLI